TQIDSLRADLEKSLASEHVGYEQLEAYVEQTLSAAERKALDSHFKSCTLCWEELRDLQAFTNQLGEQAALRSKGAAITAASCQRNRLNMLSLGFRGAWVTGGRWALAACAVIALVVGICLVWVWQHKTNTVVHKPETIPTPIPQSRKPPEI